MSKLKIIDTGFNDSNRQGTKRNGSDINSLDTYIAYEGNEITLNSGTIRFRSGMNVSDDPNPSSNQPSQVHYTSFTNRIFEIDFFINVTDADQRTQLKNI